jgi:hypothetical protein
MHSIHAHLLAQIAPLGTIGGYHLPKLGTVIGFKQVG